ncbi:MAG: hypothetical protein ACI9W2_005153, partial [Gammaproteobacteria bacterium]
MSDDNQAIVAAFETFLEQCNETLLPGAFLQWMQSHRPELVEEIGPENIAGFTRKYFTSPMRTNANTP